MSGPLSFQNMNMMTSNHTHNDNTIMDHSLVKDIDGRSLPLPSTMHRALLSPPHQMTYDNNRYHNHGDAYNDTHTNDDQKFYPLTPLTDDSSPLSIPLSPSPSSSYHSLSHFSANDAPPTPPPPPHLHDYLDAPDTPNNGYRRSSLNNSGLLQLLENSHHSQNHRSSISSVIGGDSVDDDHHQHHHHNEPPLKSRRLSTNDTPNHQQPNDSNDDSNNNNHNNNSSNNHHNEKSSNGDGGDNEDVGEEDDEDNDSDYRASEPSDDEDDSDHEQEENDNNDMNGDNDEEKDNNNNDSDEEEDSDDMEMRTDPAGVLNWIASQRSNGQSSLHVLSKLLSFFPPEFGKREAKNMLWDAAMSAGILLSKSLMRYERHRKKISSFNTFNDAVQLIRHSSKIVVLTGAGISVSAGIPDFRSAHGIYTRLRDEFGLKTPEDMFDLDCFRSNPSMFYSFAHELYPANYYPTATHQFVSLLEKNGKLLRNYTQNIDNLEEKAGIKNVIQCHGSFATASCCTCKRQVKGYEIEEKIMKKEIPYCTHCRSPEVMESLSTSTSSSSLSLPSLNPIDIHSPVYGVMKPDIVFFSEPLPNRFHEAIADDRSVADLVIVIGSSLKVYPVAGMLQQFPPSTPMILINREIVGFPDRFDVELLGDSDIVVSSLANDLGWSLKNQLSLPSSPNNNNNNNNNNRYHFIPPNRYLFPRSNQTIQDAIASFESDPKFYSSIYRPENIRPEKDFFHEIHQQKQQQKKRKLSISSTINNNNRNNNRLDAVPRIESSMNGVHEKGDRFEGNDDSHHSNSSSSSSSNHHSHPILMINNSEEHSMNE